MAHQAMNEVAARQYHVSRPQTVDPRIGKLCKLCRKALDVGRDMFASAVHSTINEAVIDSTVSIDMMHRPAPINEIIRILHPGKKGHQHVLRVYNHDRKDYVQHIGVTIIYREEAHFELCRYAHITTELERRKEASYPIFSAFHVTKDVLIRDARMFSGIGTTVVENKRDQNTTKYQIQTHLGELTYWHTTPSFKKMAAWVHLERSLPFEFDNTPAPSARHMEDSEDEEETDEEVVYPQNQPNLGFDLEELDLRTPKRRLRKAKRRGTH